MKKIGARRSFGLGLVAWCLTLFFLCRSGWSDQELVFTPTYDNLVASSFVYPDVANTAYPNAENAVGVHWSGWWDIYGSWVNTTIAYASLVYFDLSSLDGRTVKSAKLKLYPFQLADPVATVRTDYKVKAIYENWNPGAVTWNITAQMLYYDYEVLFEVPDLLQPTEIDVTTIVKNWADGVWNNYGFRISDDDYDLTYYYTYYPLVAMDHTGFGSLEFSDAPQLVVTVADDPDPIRIIRLSGDLAFGNVEVSQTATRTLTIHNDGNSTLKVYNITCPDGFSDDFWQPPSGYYPVAAGGSKDVTVTFAPIAATSYSGTITVSSDKTSGTNTRSCSGTGTIDSTRIIRLSGDLAFGAVEVGQTASQTLTIHNDGHSTLKVYNITCPDGFSDDFWQPLSGYYPVAAGGSKDVTVTFAPIATTSYSGTITVSSDKTSGTNTRSCSGTGTSAPKEDKPKAMPWLMLLLGDSGTSTTTRYVDNGDGTVTDSSTGLMWTKNAYHGPMSWYDAMTYCDSLEVGGYSDWRLPSVAQDGSTAELDTLFRSNGGPDGEWEGHEGTPFTGVQEYPSYWSDKSYDVNRAWSVDMYDGRVYYTFKSFSSPVWPVRGGP